VSTEILIVLIYDLQEKLAWCRNTERESLTALRISYLLSISFFHSFSISLIITIVHSERL